MLGRVASALLGKSVDYQVDPATGKTVATETPQKPGDLFRHILAGAILGGAAAKGQNSVLGGFSAGAKAGLEANQATDAQKRARAETDFANQQKVKSEQREDQRAADERLKTTAQIEMWNKETILHERDANLRDQEFHEAHNDRSQKIRDFATEQGGVDAPIPGNGELGNGAKFQKLFTDQPDLFRAPDGYNRIVTTDLDMNGLKFDTKLGYVDKNGNAVDLKDRTSWHVQFVPQNATKQPMDVSGADLNRLFPKTAGSLLKPNKIYRMPLEHIIGLAVKEHETNRREANEQWHYSHDEIASQLGELKSKADNFTKEAIAAERNSEFDPQAAKDAKEFRQKAQDAYDEYDEVQKQAHPQSKLRKADSGRNNPPATANKPAPVKVGDIKTVNGQRVRVTKVNPNGKYEGEPVQ